MELITNPEAERQVFERMHHLARREILTLMRPPMRISRLDAPFEKDQQHQTLARARGVVYRSILDAEYLALPGVGARVREDLAAGERLRVMPVLPLKIMLADRHIAIIPLDLNRADSPTLLVRSSALLDALHLLFENLWERATAIAASPDLGMATASPDTAGDEAAALMPLLSAGLNDKAIAHELGISPSTLARRMSTLMKRLGTRTRFQLGWRAAREAFPLRTPGEMHRAPLSPSGD